MVGRVGQSEPEPGAGGPLVLSGVEILTYSVSPGIGPALMLLDWPPEEPERCRGLEGLILPGVLAVLGISLTGGWLRAPYEMMPRSSADLLAPEWTGSVLSLGLWTLRSLWWLQLELGRLLRPPPLELLILEGRCLASSATPPPPPT